ncbi:MAG: hypothetical protein ACRDQZ_17785 [Mycobacteriales bacterium]
MKLARLCRPLPLKRTIAAAIVVASLGLAPVLHASAAPTTTGDGLSDIFASAAHEFKVPQELLMAISPTTCTPLCGTD